MIGYILTIEQKNQIQGQQYAPYQCFNCVQNINDIWFTFLTELDKETILNTEWNWILTLPVGEYVPPPEPPFPPVE
jgi:hypothetical protein